MMRFGYIVFAVIALFLSVATASANGGEVLLQHSQPCCDMPDTPCESTIYQDSYALPSTTTMLGTSQSIAPVARTLPRGTRSGENIHNASRVVSAIDSTTAAARYGLYNHKILFVPYARYYYLYRLVRLII